MVVQVLYQKQTFSVQNSIKVNLSIKKLITKRCRSQEPMPSSVVVEAAMSTMIQTIDLVTSDSSTRSLDPVPCLELS